MSGPWDQYASASQGPWTQYAEQPAGSRQSSQLAKPQFESLWQQGAKAAHVPASVTNAVQDFGVGVVQGGAGLGDFLAHVLPVPGVAAHEDAQAQALQQYEAQRRNSGQGNAVANMAGQIASPVNYAPVGDVGEGVGLAEKLGKLALQGGISGAGEAVDPSQGNYLAQKFAQIATGAAGSALGGALLHGAGAGVKYATPRVSEAVRNLWGNKTPDAIQGRAIQIVLRRFDADAAAGGPTAQTAMDAVQEARLKGIPLNLADLGGPNVQALAGTVSRASGAGKTIMANALEGRDAEAGSRLNRAISQYAANGDMRDTARTLMTARSAAAKPLWNALDDIIPTKEQLDQFQGIIASPEGQEGLGRALTTMRRNALADGARFDPKQYGVTEEKFVTYTDARPSLPPTPKKMSNLAQMGLEQPKKTLDPAFDLTSGIGGQSSKAVVHETGVKNIVAGKPSMKLLHAIKEGLDDMVEEHRDPVTNKLPTDKGLTALIRMRDVFREGLKDEFSAYKRALDAWSGPSQSLQALGKGRNALRLSPADIATQYETMGSGDRQFYRLGLAEELKKRIAQTGFSGNEARAIVKNEWTRQQLRPIFESEKDFQDFMDTVSGEHLMANTFAKLAKGSATAGRMADDRFADMETATRAAHGAAHALSGNFLAALAHAVQAAKDVSLRASPQVNAEIARLLTEGGPRLFSGAGADFLTRNASRETSNLIAARLQSATPYLNGALGVTRAQPPDQAANQ